MPERQMGDTGAWGPAGAGTRRAGEGESHGPDGDGGQGPSGEAGNGLHVVGVRERQRAWMMAAVGSGVQGARDSPARQSAPLTPGDKGRRPEAHYPPGMVSPDQSVAATHSPQPPSSSAPSRAPAVAAPSSKKLPSIAPPPPPSKGSSLRDVDLGNVSASLEDAAEAVSTNRTDGDPEGTAELVIPRHWWSKREGNQQGSVPVAAEEVKGAERRWRTGGEIAGAHHLEEQRAQRPQQQDLEQRGAPREQDPQSPALLPGQNRSPHHTPAPEVGQARSNSRLPPSDVHTSQPTSGSILNGRPKSLECPPDPGRRFSNQHVAGVPDASIGDGSNEDSDDGSAGGSSPGVVFSRRSDKSGVESARGGAPGAGYLEAVSPSKMLSLNQKTGSFATRTRAKLLSVLGKWKVESNKIQERKMMLSCLFHDEQVLGPEESEDDSETEVENISKEESTLDNWFVLVTDAIRKLIANDGKGRRLTINCGGISNQMWETTLRRFPGTTLTKMVVSGKLKNSNVAYLDRNPYAFIEILNAYRAGPGEEHGVVPEEPAHISPDLWVHELSHFRMDQAHIPGLDRLMMRYKDEDYDDIPGKPKSGVRAALFMVLEEPTSSNLAWAYSCLSFVMIMVSVSLVVIETIPGIAHDPDDPSSNPEPAAIIDNLDFVISVFMTFEYLLRLLVSVDRRAFVISPLNIIDVVAILPSYFTYLIPQARSFSGAKLFRVVRIFRIVKLTRHSDGMMVLAKTAQACSDELGLLLFCLIVFSILFAALIYFAEGNDTEGPAFESIPHAMWWAVVTMTTIGYGDMYPTTGLGQFFGAICALSGVVMVALPISVISMTFSFKFQEHKSQKQVNERRRQRHIQMKQSVITKFLSPDIVEKNASRALNGYLRKALSMVHVVDSKSTDKAQESRKSSSPDRRGSTMSNIAGTSTFSIFSDDKERAEEVSREILERRNGRHHLAQQNEGGLKELKAMRHAARSGAST